MTTDQTARIEQLIAAAGLDSPGAPLIDSSRLICPRCRHVIAHLEMAMALSRLLIKAAAHQCEDGGQ